MGFPGSATGQESACNAGGPSLIPESVSFLGEGKGYTLQYSCLEKSMDSKVLGVTKTLTRLNG